VNDKKHILVGVFVLVGAILLGTMIVWFEGVAIFVRGGYTVDVHLDSAVGIRAGKRVHLDGIEMGEVLSVSSAEPAKRGVWLQLRINPGVNIPKNAQFVAQQVVTGGDAFMDFRTVTATNEFLPQDNSARIEGTVLPPALLPADLVANLNEVLAPRTLEEVKAGKPHNLVSTLAQFSVTAQAIQDEFQQPESSFRVFLGKASTSTEELDKTLKIIQDTLTKPDSNLNQLLTESRKMVKGVDETLATVRTIADTYNKAGVSLMETSEEAKKALAQFNKSAQDIDGLVKNLNAVAENLQKGQGTMGKLMTSDELHRQLVNLVENIQKMVDNTNRLVTLWREQGFLAKEGKSQAPKRQ
jgi:phospholipid/cholesterol/gamma-HCH transport system substrate-binding protein